MGERKRRRAAGNAPLRTDRHRRAFGPGPAGRCSGRGRGGAVRRANRVRRADGPGCRFSDRGSIRSHAGRSPRLRSALDHVGRLDGSPSRTRTCDKAINSRGDLIDSAQWRYRTALVPERTIDAPPLLAVDGRHGREPNRIRIPETRRDHRSGDRRYRLFASVWRPDFRRIRWQSS